ncbi:disks large-associated protein 3 isoform X1 [Hippocampus zosterae]|uniref:disks large-associated protein 3 isoform X1 n=1 Tax=Hippocampus zosterae TaxID=109293 RepID=UPI00223E0BCF|nr:disks large-associated protein 3 isoform X1 [Hippocampus zosterae]XP_051927933.1 disks large-associated protein 3 isoform X1 [Hippocampus zosterae]
MKGYHVGRSLSQHSSGGGGGGGPCHCPPEDCDGPGGDYYHGHGDGHYYPPGGPAEALALERHHSHSHSHSHSGGGTFPRSHPSQHPPLQSFDSCEECLSSGHGGKMHRIPPNLMDQFEKRVPFHPDGFHTLQYQRATSGGAEQRSESPSRIRHLVNSVQRLFAKSHSLEAPSKREYNGTRGGGDYRGERGGGHRSAGEDAGAHYSGHQSRSARRNKSRERSKSGDSRHESGRRHRGRTAGWWSSDDNLDSDSSFLVSGGRKGYPGGHESLDAAIRELTTKRPKERGGGPGPAECAACTTIALAGSEGGGHPGHTAHSMKRSTWSAMTVSQAREVYPSRGGGGGYDKALVPVENKLKERTLHYLQVPSEDWGGGYGGTDGGGGGEIPCRRMRSGSYIKAMGDDDSADSDSSPKASPKSTLIAQRDAFRRSISMDQRYSCKQCTDSYPNSRTTPKSHARSRSYTRSLTSSQLGDTLDRQFEAVCETMFGEVESQAVEALDLPGVFRTRSHSYVRAIQAGCSQDDDCLSVFSLSGPQGSVKAGAVFPYRKGAPPPLPPRMSKSSLSVRAQSSTESTQDAYYQSSHGRCKPHSNSVDLGCADGTSGRSSRAGYYAAAGPGRSRQHSNSAESLDGGMRGSREMVPYAGGPGVGVRAKHSSSADSLLEGPPRAARERDGRVGGSLGKSVSLPQNSIVLSKAGGQDDGCGGRKWRPSIAVQVDSSETLSDSDADGKAVTEVHSIGVQVEDDKRRARFKRSNSVTASVQADLDPEGFPGLSVAVPMQDKSLQFGCSFQRHSSEPESAGQYTECHRTVHTQGQWAYREDFIQSGYTAEACPGDPRSHQHQHLPPRSHSPLPLSSERGWAGTPSLEGPRSLPDSGRASPCMRDGEFFLRLLQTEVERMEGWCQNMEREAEENELPEEILELIRNAVGSAQMLMSQKVQQFFRLCQQSVDPSSYPQPTTQDLAGLWDLLQLNIEDIRVKFQDLQRLKDSGWKLPVEKKEDKKLPPPLPKKPAGGVSGSLRADSVGEGGGGGGSGGLVVPRLGGHTLPLREKSLDLVERQRTEARRRLLQTKRTASFRQNSATESADSIEIYIPEAQTRL